MKRIAILLAACAFLALTLFSGCSNVRIEPDAASSDEKSRIETALAELHGWDFAYPIINAGTEGYEFAGSLCYGVINGRAAVMIPASDGTTEHSAGGFAFDTSVPVFIDIITDGGAYPIEEAYSAGMIGKGELEAFHKIHAAEAEAFLTAEKKYAIRDDAVIIMLTRAESLEFKADYGGYYETVGNVLAEEITGEPPAALMEKAEELRALGFAGAELAKELEEAGMEYRRIFRITLPEKSTAAAVAAAEWFAEQSWVESAEPESLNVEAFGG